MLFRSDIVRTEPTQQIGETTPYKIVQRAAAAAWDAGVDFRAALASDPEVGSALSSQDLDALFDPMRFLRNLGGVFEKLEKLPVDEGASR